MTDEAAEEPSRLATSKPTAEAEFDASEAGSSSSAKCRRGSPDQTGNHVTHSGSRDAQPAPPSPDNDDLDIPSNQDDGFRFIGEHVDSASAIDGPHGQILVDDVLDIDSQPPRPGLKSRRHTLAGGQPEEARAGKACPSCSNPAIGCAAHASGLHSGFQPSQVPRISTRMAIEPSDRIGHGPRLDPRSASYSTRDDLGSDSSAYILSSQTSSISAEPKSIPRYMPPIELPEEES